MAAKRKEWPAVAPEATPAAVEPKASRYHVAGGHSICGTPRGMLQPGHEVFASDLGDGVAALERLCAKGVLVKS